MRKGAAWCVANFFWTPPNDALIGTPNMVAAGNIPAGVPEDFQHPNNEPSLYGLRKLGVRLKALFSSSAM